MSAGHGRHDVDGARVARHLRRLGHHRPHLARPARSSRPRPPATTCMEHDVAVGRLQQLRRAPRQPRGDDARHLRQRAHQEPDDAAKADGTRVEGGVTLHPAGGRADADLRRGDEVHRRGHADRGVRRRGIRHRLARATGRPRARSCSASRRWSRAASSASTAPTWSAWACCRCSSRARDSVAVARASRATRPSTSSGLESGIQPQQDVTLVIHRKDGTTKEVTVLLRIDTPIEVDYYLHGGILPFVLRELVSKQPAAAASA